MSKFIDSKPTKDRKFFINARVGVALFIVGIFFAVLSKFFISDDIITYRFIKTGNTYFIGDRNWSEYLDTETYNLYLHSNNAGLCPLYDKDGNIKKYTGNLEERVIKR